MKLAVLTAAVSMGAGAMADEMSGKNAGLYFGGGVGAYGIDIDGIDFDDEAGFWRGVAGVRLSPNLAIEGDYTRLLETSGNVLGADADLKADAWGVSLRPILPLSEQLDLYGRVGWTWYDADFSTSAFGTPVTVGGHDDDFTWGGGVDLHLTDNLSLRGDFSRIEVKDANLNLVSAQLTFRF